MNLQLKAVYYCATIHNKWGKGLTIKEAKKNAGISTLADEKKTQFFVMAACLMKPTNEELEEMRKCIVADVIGGGPVYYQDNRTKEDSELIARLHVGWLQVERNYE